MPRRRLTTGVSQRRGMKPRHHIAWAAGALVLCAIYVASYALTVHPAVGPTIAGRSLSGRLAYGDTIPLEPVFRFGDYKATRAVFSPLLRIDRGVRSSRWTYTETNHLRPCCGYQIELEARWKAATEAATNK